MKSIYSVIVVLFVSVGMVGCCLQTGNRTARHNYPKGVTASQLPLLMETLNTLLHCKTAECQEKAARNLMIKWKTRDTSDVSLPSLYVLALDENRKPVRWQLLKNTYHVRTILIGDAGFSRSKVFEEFELRPLSLQVVLILRTFILSGPYHDMPELN